MQNNYIAIHISDQEGHLLRPEKEPDQDVLIKMFTTHEGQGHDINPKDDGYPHKSKPDGKI